jgi:starvation-inducible DNA-binding protein
MTAIAMKLNEETRTQTTAELQALLVDLIALGLQGKQAHWNVIGPFFRSVHEQMDNVVDDAREWSDEVAERIVTIGAAAAGQPSDVASDTSLEPLPAGPIADGQALRLMAERIASVASRGRDAMHRLGEVDLASQDLVIEIVKGLEKHLWMLSAQIDK